MHGLMFREFFQFAESATSKGFVDDMIHAIHPDGDADYRAHGPYDPNRLIAMMDFLATRTGYDASDLRYDFGKHLFQRFTALHSDLFAGKTDALDFLQGIEAHIHEQMRMSVPKSDPPRFDIQRPQTNQLVLHYQSSRPFADLCAGLIEAALEHYQAGGCVERRLVGRGKHEAVFTITTDRMVG